MNEATACQYNANKPTHNALLEKILLLGDLLLIGGFYLTISMAQMIPHNSPLALPLR